jgi:hypothetical protein
VVFSWSVQNVREVYFYAEGESWQGNGVAGQGQQTECPPHTMAYYLRVVKNDGSVDTRSITITVVPGEGPTIQQFTVDPGSLSVGQCVTIRWKVAGAVDQVDISVDGRMLWGAAPNSGNYKDCPTSTGSPTYRIDARGPGGSSQQQKQVQVSGGEVPPTPVPDAPVIYAFAVQPEQIQAGQCVNITWSAGGGTSWINIVRNETTILENAPLQGSAQDCPDETGELLYVMVAFNPRDERTRADQTVIVNP